jgi:antitoxin component of RelBE/YafQ-DinJ toxin-antitoxin module
MVKDATFKMRLGHEDRERFDALAEHYAAPVATVLRMLAKRDADKLGLPAAKPKATARKARKGAAHGA